MSTDGGSAPVWTRSGRELTYRERVDGERRIFRVMAADIDPGGESNAQLPRELFGAELRDAAPIRSYDVSPDGSRFVVIRRARDMSSPPGGLCVIANWFDAFRRLAAQQEEGG